MADITAPRTERRPEATALAPGRAAQLVSWSRAALSSYRGQLVVALALGVAARLWVLVSSRGMIDGDEAVLGIQAEDILRGAHPIYFYGQPYMGSWEAYLAAPIIALFGPSANAFHSVGFAESLVLVPLLGALAEKLYGARARFPAMLLAAVPPLYIAIGELHMLGGYVETLVLGTALLLLAVSIADRWVERRRTLWLWLLAGLCTGLALWIDPLVAYYLVAGGLWLVAPAVARLRADGEHLAWRRIGAAAGAFVAGAIVTVSPAIVYALQNDFANVTTYLAPADALAQTHPLRLGVARYLVEQAVPHVAGITTVWDATPLAHHINIALGVLVGAITLAAAVYASVLPARHAPRRRGDWLALDAGAGRRFWGYVLAPLLACVIAVIYWRSPSTGNNALETGVDVAGRYALPLTTALTLMLAAGLGDLGPWIARWSARDGGTDAGQGRRKRLQAVLTRVGPGLAVALVLVLYAVPYTDSNNVAAMQSTYRQYLGFPADNSELLTYIEQQHIHAIWANHWIGNVVMYLEDERVACADWVDIRVYGGHDRFPQAFATVAAAERPSFLIETHPGAGPPATPHALDALGVTYTSAQFGALWIITPLSRTVQPQEIAAALQQDY